MKQIRGFDGILLNQSATFGLDSGREVCIAEVASLIPLEPSVNKSVRSETYGIEQRGGRVT